VAAAEEQRLRALLEQHVAKCLEGQQPRPSALKLKLELVEGAAADVIRNAVERLGPDLLSLGANSRSGLAENFIGSTTREFLVHAPCDILVAHVPGQVACERDHHSWRDVVTSRRARQSQLGAQAHARAYER
jgi:nucleotide-binding universal stress UspA family protein